MRRRDFLRGLATAAVAAPLSCGRDRTPSEPPSPTLPRKTIVIYLSGGPDGVLTLDPKTPSEIESWVDNPLQKDSVDAGAIRLGALWAPLARWAPQMAILHGVQVESANHFAGSWQYLRMRRRALMDTPGILDLIAANRDSPLGAVTVGSLFNRTYTPSWLPLAGEVIPDGGSEGLAAYDALAPDELRELAAVLHEQASGSPRPADGASYRRVAAYLDALQRTPRFVDQDWKLPPGRFANAASGMQRVLWTFEHDLASTAFVYFGNNGFDTHYSNLERQRGANGAFVTAFGHFLDELARRRNAHGTLAEQTTIVVSGELGRYPRINSDQGKDHYPEISMLLMGAGVNAGRVVGQTGKDMLGVPMDLATGKLVGSSHVMLDHVGTTLLTLSGIEPTRYGYPAQPIEPLLP